MKGTTNSQRGTGGGGEKLVISLKTNQISHIDLIGAKFSVVINGNATEYTWQGASMTIPIPPMLNYTVEFGEVEGYAKPESVIHTAVAGNDRFVTGTYNTELVTVNVLPNEESVNGYEIGIYKVSRSTESVTGYTELEYIESYYNQYINTGINGRIGICVDMDMAFVELPNDGTVIGCATSGYYLDTFVPIHYKYGEFLMKSGGTFESVTSMSVGTKFNIKSKILSTNGGMWVNGTKVISESIEPSLNVDLPMYVCGCNEKGSITYKCAIKIYNLKIYENNILLRDYVPVKNSSGKAGLYDKVEQIFYPSLSGTDFIAGNEKGPFIHEFINETKELLYTQTNRIANHKIPYGTLYSVEASYIESYLTPANQHFTASDAHRNVYVNYISYSYGVYIQGASRELYTLDEWNNQETPNGVAVINDKISFVMANYYVEEAWSSGTYLDVPGVTTEAYKSNLSTYVDSLLDGYKCTNLITNSTTTGLTIANECKNYTFPNGNKGYLGSVEQFKIVFDNRDAILAAYDAIGFTPSGIPNVLWTSISYNSGNAYYVKQDLTKAVGTQNKQNTYYAIPFTTL